MKIGDLVKQHPDECSNQVPGLVVGRAVHRIDDAVVYQGHDYLHVQWFDWAVGDIAVENPSGLVLVSESK